MNVRGESEVKVKEERVGMRHVKVDVMVDVYFTDLD